MAAAQTDYSPASDLFPASPPIELNTASMSLGQPPAPGSAGENGNGGTTAANGNGTNITSPTTGARPPTAELPKAVQEVLESEIGIVTMLNRLKQSIASAKEFAQFLKKRAQLEDDHANSLRKVAKMTSDTMARPDHMGGSFAVAYTGMMNIHERMADNGYQYSMSLQQMHDDLAELAAISEKNRKGWKVNGMAAEQKVIDLDAAMRKSKARYNQLADEYDRMRTGDTSGRRGFGFKGPKSGAQAEEDLLRKVQAADQDYASKVSTLQHERRELINITRPEAIKAIQDIIRECDGALVLQVQKFASFNEKLLLSNGLAISPLKNHTKPEATGRSLREMVTAIDNQEDLNDYLAAHYSKVPPKTGEPQYERNPVLGGAGGQPASMPKPFNSVQSPTAMQPPQPFGTRGRTGSVGGIPDSPQTFSPTGPPTMPAAQGQRPSSGHERSFSTNSGPGYSQNTMPSQAQSNRNSIQQIPNSRFNTVGSTGLQGAPQLGALPFQTQPTPASQPPQQQMQMPGPQLVANPLMSHPPGQQRPGSSGMGQMRNQSPPRMAKPVFGVSLQRLYDRDALAVPMVVYQCIQAVDLFGLGVEGIYRVSGSQPHVNKLKGMFDTDSSSGNLDFRNPENFFHDVNGVASLLKLFFRDLPDPLFTKEHYSGFIDAAKAEDDTVRRDSLHAIINALPDPNYATLRALTLHLARVMDNSSATRMNSQNLAIVFGPTLMGTGAGSNIADAGWQVKVVETILNNTYQIFDED